ncbi:hypothetical protein EE612_052272 [Oryza sativa]|nr:hypothetical protein EE612_052272 [Oryza sativa]
MTIDASPWLLLLVAFLFPFFVLRSLRSDGKGGGRGGGCRVPPGPLAVPVLGNLLWLWHSPADLEPLLRRLIARHGPVVSLRVGSRLSIFVADRRVAHAALWWSAAPRSPTARRSRALSSARTATPSRAPATGRRGASCAAASSPGRCTRRRRAPACSRPRAPGRAACSSASWPRRPARLPMASWTRSSTPCSASSWSCASASGSTRPTCAPSPRRSTTGSCTSRRR